MLIFQKISLTRTKVIISKQTVYRHDEAYAMTKVWASHYNMTVNICGHAYKIAHMALNKIKTFYDFLPCK